MNKFHSNLTLVFLFFNHITFAQNWKTFLDSADYYQKNGLYKKMFSVVQKSYFSYPDTQKSDTNLYQLYKWVYIREAEIGNIKRALHYAKKLADLSNQIYGKESKEYLSDVVKVANLSIQETGTSDSLSLLLLEKCSKEPFKNTSLHAKAVKIRAKYHLETTNYPEAERLYLESINLFHKLRDTTEYLFTKRNLAYFYRIIGSYDKAEQLIFENLSAYKPPYSSEYYTNLRELATISEKRKQYSRAESLLKVIIQYAEENIGSESSFYSSSINNLGLIYDKTGKYKDAETCYRKTLSIMEKNGSQQTKNYATTLNNLAITTKNQKKYKDAEVLYLQVLELRKKILGINHPDYNNILNNIAIFYQTTKQYHKADSFYVEMIQKVINTLLNNFKNLNEKEKQDYLKDHAIYIDNFTKHCFLRSGVKNDSLLNPKFFEYGYNHQLNTKGILINNMQKLKNHIEKSKNPSVKVMFQEWNTLRNQIASYHKMTVEQQREKNINIPEMEKKADSLEKELSYQSPDFYELIKNQEITWKNVQKKLKKNEAAIEIVRIPVKDSVHYLAYIVTSKCVYPHAVYIPDGIQLEKNYLLNYRRSIKNKIKDTMSYVWYWKPIHTYLKTNKVKKVHLSCDGVYHQINVNTIYINSNTPVIDEIEVFYVTNTRDLAVRKEMKSSKNAVLIGNPDFKANLPDSLLDRGTTISALPGTNIEIQGIKTIMDKKKWKSDVYTQSEANESKLKNLPRCAVLHIATHGFFDNNTKHNSMLNSGLLLSGAEKTMNSQNFSNESDDGIFTAYEAMNIELDNTELVILSACETGLGNSYHSATGIYGLQRAFKVAGTKYLIMSLWKVSDNTTQLLMKTFYHYWINEKLSIHDAFSKAQREIKKKYPDPYYWGAFILLG